MRHFQKKRSCSGSLMFTLGLMCCLIGVAGAQESVGVSTDGMPGAREISGDATCYLYRMGWDELKPRLAGTPALKAIEEPAVQAFFDEIRRVGERNKDFADTFRFLLSALHQEVIIAGRSSGTGGAPAGTAPGVPATRTEEEEEAAEAREETEEAGHGPVWPQVAFAKASPVGQSSFRQSYDKMIGALAEGAGKIESIEAGGMKFDRLGDEEAAAYTGWKDDRFIWTTGREAVDWVAGFGKRPGQSLAQAELFRTTMDPLLEGTKGGPLAAYWYDLRPGWQRLSVVPGWEGLSWRSLDAVAGAAFVEDGRYRIRHYWKVGGDDRRVGLFRHTRASRVDAGWLQRVPADATGFTTGVWDANSFLLSVVGLFARMTGSPEIQAVPMATMFMKPLTDQLGPRYLFYRVAGRYGAFPFADAIPLSDMVIVSELKDAEVFTNTLRGMTAMVPTGGDRATVAGHEVTAINVMYFTLYLATVDNVVIMTIHPQLMKDAIEGWKQPGASIVDTPAYQAAEKHILPDACFQMYIAPGGFSRGIYDRYIPMLQQMAALAQGFSGMGGGPNPPDRAARGFSPLAFPRGSAFARNAPNATILTARDDGEGVLFDGRSDVLCTPYYWMYLHALVRLNPDPEGSIWQLLQFMAMPMDPETTQHSSRVRIEESEPVRVAPGEEVTE